MDYVYIGKIVNTHALKGEVRLISDFEYKELVFKQDKIFYIGEPKDKEVVETYRKHKNYDMVKFKGIDYINDVLKYKGKDVYVLREDIDLNDKLLDNDLIGLECFFNNNSIGFVKEIINNNGYKLFSINEKLIPYNNNFIEVINKEKVIFKNIEELIK